MMNIHQLTTVFFISSVYQIAIDWYHFRTHQRWESHRKAIFWYSESVTLCMFCVVWMNGIGVAALIEQKRTVNNNHFSRKKTSFHRLGFIREFQEAVQWPILQAYSAISTICNQISQQRFWMQWWRIRLTFLLCLERNTQEMNDKNKELKV